jgi:hypothetical protein
MHRGIRYCSRLTAGTKPKVIQVRMVRSIGGISGEQLLPVGRKAAANILAMQFRIGLDPPQ